MKTLIELKIEPQINMIVYALKGRLKHHIIEFGNRFDHYENNKPVYCKYVHTINEKGSGNWIEYNKFISNYSYVGMSVCGLKDLFKNDDRYMNKIKELNTLMKSIGDILNA